MRSYLIKIFTVFLFIHFFYGCHNNKDFSKYNSAPSEDQQKAIKYLISSVDVFIDKNKISRFAGSKAFYFTDDLDGYNYISIPDGEYEYYPSSDGIRRQLTVSKNESTDNWEFSVDSECYTVGNNYKPRKPFFNKHEEYEEVKFKDMNYQRSVPKEIFLYCYVADGWNHCYYRPLYKSGIYCEHFLVADSSKYDQSVFSKILDRLETRLSQL